MKCSNMNIGFMIGRYEFGLLSDKEKTLFENHILECDSCYQNLYEFRPIQEVLKKNKKRINGILYSTYLLLNLKIFFLSLQARITGLLHFDQNKWKYCVGIISLSIIFMILSPILRKASFLLHQEDVITLHGYQTEVMETTGYHIYSDQAADLSQANQFRKIDMLIDENNNIITFHWTKDPNIYTFDIEIFKSGENNPLYNAQGVQDTQLVVPVEQFNTKVIYQLMLTGKGQNDKYYRVTKNFRLE